MTTATRRSGLRTSPWTGDDGEGLAVYDPRTDDGYLLNAATAAVFEACDGATSIDQMAERIAARTGLPAAPEIVELALAELTSCGLLEGEPTAAPGRSAAPSGPTGLSRRALMTRLAIGAGAAALLPAIDMIGGVSRLAADTGPTNAAQATIPPVVAQDKSASTLVDTPVPVTLSATGGYVSPDSVAFMVSTPPTHGTVDIVGAVATYTPAAGFVGTDTFTYIAWQCVALADAVLACPDGTGAFPDTGSDPATVTITVTAPATTTTGVAPTTEAAPAVQSAATPRFTG